MADESVRERVAIMIGWKLDEPCSVSPDGTLYLDIPAFDTSLDACASVIHWIRNRDYRSWPDFVTQLGKMRRDNRQYWPLQNTGKLETAFRNGMERALLATPMEICEAALAVGDKR